MSGWFVLLPILLAVISFWLLHRIMGNRHPIRGTILRMLFGLLCLAAVNLCSSFTGAALPVSRLSLLLSAVLGIPGVITMLLLELLL